MELITWLSIVIPSAAIASIIITCCCKRYQEGRVLGPSPVIVQRVQPMNVTYVSTQQPLMQVVATQTAVVASGPSSIGWQQPPPPYSAIYYDENQRTTTEYYMKQSAFSRNY
ncbi:hypothetical protein Trydic_g5198 [Trypoxylus dichotomus]